MSLQALFSFDHVVTADLANLPRVVYVGDCLISTTGGRDNGGCLTSTSDYTEGFNVAIDPYNDVTIGAWILFEGILLDDFFVLCNPAHATTNNPSGAHCSVGVLTDGSIVIYKAFSFGSVIATSPPGS